MTSKTELWNEFEDHFKIIVEDLSSCDTMHDISWSCKRIKDILEYNVPFGKRTRGLTVVMCYDAIWNGKESSIDRKVIMTLGWAVEVLQAAFLVADDLMDQSETRRGKLCWYRNEEVGYQAVNDCMILESCVFFLLRKHCRNLDCYADLVDLFHQVLLKTELGQSLDMAVSEQPTVDFSCLTEEKYNSIIKYKTAYYSFYLPVAVALHVSGIASEECHTKACNILTQIGSLFQVQDDVLDCYGDPKVTGKIGTDIKDNKCSWLIIKAISLANAEQYALLESCYGKKSSDQIEKVKNIYSDLNIFSVFEKYECETYENISAQIRSFDDDRVPKSVFLDLLNKIYKRKK